MTGNSRQRLLNQLLEHKSGATLDELAGPRPEQNGGQPAPDRARTGRLCPQGRPAQDRRPPEQIYVLTEDGINLFPKQYSWFSKLLIQTLREQFGEEQAARNTCTTSA